MRLLATAALAVVLSACGRSNLDADGGTGGGTGGMGGGSAAGGGGGAIDSGTSCNTVPDDGPILMPICPGFTPCSQCNVEPGDGGTVLDGTYSLVGETFYASACGIVSGDPSHATLSIQNGVMQLVSTGPQGLSWDTPTIRLTMSFTVSGNGLALTQTCPPDASNGFPVPFTAAGDVLVVQSLPGLIGEPTFLKRP